MRLIRKDVGHVTADGRYEAYVRTEPRGGFKGYRKVGYAVYHGLVYIGTAKTLKDAEKLIDKYNKA